MLRVNFSKSTVSLSKRVKGGKQRRKRKWDSYRALLVGNSRGSGYWSTKEETEKGELTVDGHYLTRSKKETCTRQRKEKRRTGPGVLWRERLQTYGTRASSWNNFSLAAPLSGGRTHREWWQANALYLPTFSHCSLNPNQVSPWNHVSRWRCWGVRSELIRMIAVAGWQWCSRQKRHYGRCWTAWRGKMMGWWGRMMVYWWWQVWWWWNELADINCCLCAWVGDVTTEVKWSAIGHQRMRRHWRWGAEASVRWRRCCGLGCIAKGRFIPIEVI